MPDEPYGLAEALFVLHSNVEARMIFQNKLNLSAFEIAHLAAEIPFEKAYLCEQAFSTLVNLKAKLRNRLDAEDYMQVAVTLKIPDLDGIISKLKQPHFSKPEQKMIGVNEILQL